MEGYEINERMRALLIDWLIQVHSRFQLLQETLYMTVAILDRFLQVKLVKVVACPLRLLPDSKMIVYTGTTSITTEAPTGGSYCNVACLEV